MLSNTDSSELFEYLATIVASSIQGEHPSQIKELYSFYHSIVWGSCIWLWFFIVATIIISSLRLLRLYYLDLEVVLVISILGGHCLLQIYLFMTIMLDLNSVYFFFYFSVTRIIKKSLLIYFSSFYLVYFLAGILRALHMHWQVSLESL